MATYYDLVISGKSNSFTVGGGDSAYNTVVGNRAVLWVSGGGYVENTTVYNNAAVSNAGVAASTFLSGGTLTLISGGTANAVSVMRNGKLSVPLGAVATEVFMGSSAVINATVKGGDSVTRITGTNELGSFVLSDGVASNFMLSSTGQLTLSNGGVARDIVIHKYGTLTVSGGAVAENIVQESGGKLTTTIIGGDSATRVTGSHVSGTFLLSGGVASGFILYENAAQHVSNGGIASRSVVIEGWAHQYVYAGGTALETTIGDKGSMTIYGGGVASGAMVWSGGSMMTNGGSVCGATVYGELQVTSATVGPDESGGTALVGDVTVMPGGKLIMIANALFAGEIAIRGELDISFGVTVNGQTVSSGGSASVQGTFNLTGGSSWNTDVKKNGTVNAGSGATLFGLAAASGARVNVSSGATIFELAAASGARVDVAPGAVLAGTRLEIAENTIFCGGTALGMTAAYGRVSGLGADGRACDLVFGSGVTLAGARVVSGGRLGVLSGATLDDAVIQSGGLLVLSSGADTGKRLFFDFSNAAGGTVAAMVDNPALVSSDTAICLTGLADGGVYTVAPDAVVHIYGDPSDVGDVTLAAGESGADVFGGMTYVFDSAGTTVSATALPVMVLSSYASLNDSATAIGDDLAAKWADFTETGTLTAVDWDFDGNAWLELDGTRLSGARLYGVADNEYVNGVLNLKLTSGTVIGNLAAGAGNWGAVGGVNLTIDAATLEGVSYAGGFGHVAYYDDDEGWVYGDVTTHIKSGTFRKDFYAGALCNFAKNGEGSETDVGNVTLTVDDGTFDGNLYGASAVKVNTPGKSNIHSVNDDVSITLNGGEATAGGDFCLFAGGYATGRGYLVYEVNGSIDLTINGGQWGADKGGRGIFGGIMASGVAAEAGDVNITVTGGKMGTIYGGGRAQQSGSSTVGDVNITVSGGTTANILGSGSHSRSGGTTTVGDVNITVSGGDIQGDIFARGYFDGDSVTGTAAVTFTGATDFDCGVWGYSRVPLQEDTGTAGDATLNFTAYTGTFSGGIGGFDDGILLSSSTVMTLATAAEDVSAGEWEFDVTGRDAALANVAMLTWNVSGIDFTDSLITLDLVSGDQTEWSLLDAAADTVYGQFDVLSDETSILSETIGLDEPIAGTGTDWDGWGFTVDGGVLKFKNLA